MTRTQVQNRFDEAESTRAAMYSTRVTILKSPLHLWHITDLRPSLLQDQARKTLKSG